LVQKLNINVKMHGEHDVNKSLLHLLPASPFVQNPQGMNIQTKKFNGPQGSARTDEYNMSRLQSAEKEMILGGVRHVWCGAGHC
jgi:hypothetical protein